MKFSKILTVPSTGTRNFLTDDAIPPLPPPPFVYMVVVVVVVSRKKLKMSGLEQEAMISSLMLDRHKVQQISIICWTFSTEVPYRLQMHS